MSLGDNLVLGALAGGSLLSAAWIGSGVEVKVGEPLKIDPPTRVLSQSDERETAEALAKGKYPQHARPWQHWRNDIARCIVMRLHALSATAYCVVSVRPRDSNNGPISGSRP